MTSARPLRELLADLAGDAHAARAHGGDPQAYLAAHGHPDLPADLVAEAVVNYADTAPAEVAEHLAPFVTAHTGGADPEADLFGLLTSAPVGADEGAVDDDPMLDDLPDADGWPGDLGPDPGPGLDFGAGASAEVGVAAPGPDEPGDADAVAEAPAEPGGWTAVEAEQAPLDPTTTPDIDLDTPNDTPNADPDTLDDDPLT